jgi:hypothetical protein
MLGKYVLIEIPYKEGIKNLYICEAQKIQYCLNC